MNFVFGAIIILILVLPGFAFRISYLTKSFKQIFKGSFSEEFAFTLIPTLVIQVPFYLLVNWLVCDINEQQLYLLIINSEKAELSSITIGLFGLYTLAAVGIAVFLGTQFRRKSLEKNWHLKYGFLKIFNDWEEYFSGYVLDRVDMPGSHKDVAVTWLDLVVEVKNETYLYSGFLAYFTVTTDEKLDRVFLKAVRRKKLDHVRNNNGQQQDESKNNVGEENYHMPGDFFIVLGGEIKNVNITYYAAKD